MSHRWAEIAGTDRGSSYAARFDRLAARGEAVHGEATLCAALVAPGARILDAGCGTGRVAIRLAQQGFRVTGLDADDAMLDEARRRAPDLEWVLADLATWTPGDEGFDLVVAAGNVVPLLDTGTEATSLANLAGALAGNGLLVTGFGLDAAHLPLAAAPFGLAEYDDWCVSAGLVTVARYATWDREPYVDGGGYAVTIHRRE